MKALVVANPAAGSRRRQPELATIARCLREAGVRAQRVAASSVRKVQARLREALASESPDETRVIAVGGDGTINAVLPALAGSGFTLGIIPSGTLNALAGELGIPRGIREATSVCLGGRTRQIDLGSANGRPFALMAGAGFDAAVVHSVVPAANKNMLGYSALRRGLRLLATYTPTRLRITTETESVETEAWLALIANARHYSYCLQVAPQAAADDGWLDVWLLESGPAVHIGHQVLGLLRGRPGDCCGVFHLRTQRLRVDSEPPVSVQVDGDQAGRTPVDISIMPAALKVMIPEAVAGHRPAGPGARPPLGQRWSLSSPPPRRGPSPGSRQ